MATDKLSGGCMCGAVRYEKTGPPSRVLHCHCESCRKHTGAPAATLAVFRADQVRFSGSARTIYASAPNVGRAFCCKCGSWMSWETVLGDEGKLCAIHISSFDTPDALTPTGHSFYLERISWFDIADNLPRHEGFVANSQPLCHGPAAAKPFQPD